MNKREHNILSKPIVAAILFTLYGEALYVIVGMIIPEPAVYFALPVVFLLVLLIHKWWFRPEYKGSFGLQFLHDRSLLICLAIFVAVDLLDTAYNVAIAGFTLPELSSAAAALTAGICEEVEFRALPVSVMMRTLKDKNSYKLALILPAILFGLIHFMNMLDEQSLLMTVIQVISAACAGLMFGAIFLRSGSIILPMAIHFLHDILCAVIATSGSEVVSAADFIEVTFFTIIQLLITWFILKGQKQHILEVWQEKWANESET